jgi:hypothetical protein
VTARESPDELNISKQDRELCSTGAVYPMYVSKFGSGRQLTNAAMKMGGRGECPRN